MILSGITRLRHDLEDINFVFVNILGVVKRIISLRVLNLAKRARVEFLSSLFHIALFADLISEAILSFCLLFLAGEIVTRLI